jgi:hypothetical protein
MTVKLGLISFAGISAVTRPSSIKARIRDRENSESWDAKKTSNRKPFWAGPTETTIFSDSAGVGFTEDRITYLTLARPLLGRLDIKAHRITARDTAINMPLTAWEAELNNRRYRLSQSLRQNSMTKRSIP